MERVAITGIRQPIIFDKQHDCPFERPFGYIYRVTNKINGHMYIGKHKYNKPKLDKSYIGSGYILNKAYDRYGMKSFTMEILEWVNTNDDDLNEAEIKWIDVFNTYNNPEHYNMTPGGDGVSLPGESNPMFGVSLTGSKNGMFGKTHTPEVRQLLREMKLGKPSPRKGVKLPEEQKRHQSEVMKGRYAGEKNYFFGKQYNGSKNGFSKRMVQLTLDDRFVREYSYIGEAKKYGFDSHYTCKVCRGEKESYKGYKFMYKEDYEAMLQQREAQ